MHYLIEGNTQINTGCICYGCGGCPCDHPYICGLRYDQEEACPKHCWSQVCTTAKTDPFNLIL